MDLYWPVMKRESSMSKIAEGEPLDLAVGDAVLVYHPAASKRDLVWKKATVQRRVSSRRFVVVYPGSSRSSGRTSVENHFNLVKLRTLRGGLSEPVSEAPPCE